MSLVPQNADEALLAESVRVLAIAWRNLAAYPAGHPARIAALEAAHRRLGEALAPAGRLVLGIAPDGLVFGEKKLHSPQAVKLAQAFYRRNVAVLTLEEGLAPSEIESLLRLLGEEEAAAGGPPLWEALAAAGVEHAQLQAVDYSGVTVTSADDAPEPADLEGSLWDAILAALVAGHGISPTGRDVRSLKDSSDSEITALLEGVFGTAAGGTGGGTGAGTGTGPAAASVVGSASAMAAQVADAVAAHLSRVHGPGRQVTAQQITALVRSLPVEVRETIVTAALRAVAGDEMAADALATLAAAVSPDAVVKCLRKLGAEGVKLSKHALRLADALAVPPPEPAAEGEPPPAEGEVASLLGEVRRLYGEEDIDRLSPEDHKALYERVVVETGQIGAAEPAAPGALEDRVESLTDDFLAERLVPTLLEVLARRPLEEGAEPILARLVALFRAFVSADRLEPAIVLVSGTREVREQADLPDAAGLSFQSALDQMASRESILTLLGGMQQASGARAALVRRLIELLGAAAARNCLFALSEETNRSRRRHLFDFLVVLGPVIAPTATQLLADERWFVVRNMILLLRTVNDRASLPEIQRCARHPDLRVRLEAIKSLFVLGVDVPREMLDAAIHDPDPKLAETAIALVGQYGITEAVDPLLDIVSRWDPFGRRRSVRLRALRALGDLAVPDVLPSLGRFLKNYRFLPLVALEERRAAFKSLESYPAVARLPFVERGLRSRDPEIRRLCERLSRAEAAPPVPPEEEN